jgi:hypothetical protein
MMEKRLRAIWRKCRAEVVARGLDPGQVMLAEDEWVAALAQNPLPSMWRRA